MGIRKALGFGIFIIVLKLLIPNILSEGEKTAISFMQGAQISAGVASSLVGDSGTRKIPQALPPFPLPQAQQIRYSY